MSQEACDATSDELAKIERGIEAYARQQQILLRVIRRKRELSERDFDRIFSWLKPYRKPDGMRGNMRRRPAFCYVPLRGHTIILGGMSGSDRNKWLHLAQLMIVLRKIEAEERDGLVYYSLPAGGSDGP